MKKQLLNLTMLLLVLLMGGVNALGAEKVVQEDYDFNTWGKSNLDRDSYATIQLGSDPLFQVENVNLYPVTSFTGTKTSEVWTLQTERLAFSDNVTYRYGRGSGDVPRVGNEYASGARYISIVNLKKGDKVIFKTVSNFSFASSNVTVEGSDIAAGTAVEASKEYVIKDDGHIDIKCESRTWANISNMSVIINVSDDECEAPTYKITKVSGTERNVELSCSTAESAIYYSEIKLDASADGWTQYNGAFSTKAEKIYAYAKKGSASSDVITFNIDGGTAVALNKPTFSNLYYDASKKAYAVKIADDQSNVLCSPTAKLQYYTDKDNTRKDITSGSFVDNIAEGDEITVIATAEGYEASENTLEIPSTREADGYATVWFDDFTSGEALTNDGNFMLSKVTYEIITKIGDKELSGNTGLYAYNSTRWNSTTDGLKPTNSYYFGVQNVGTNGYVKINVSEDSYLNNLVSARSSVAFSYAVKNEDGTMSVFFKPNGAQSSWNGFQGLVIKSVSFVMPTTSLSLSTDYTYSTYTPSSDVNLTNENGVEFYAAKANGNKVVLTKVEGAVKAGTGLLVKNTNRVASVTLAAAADGQEVAENALVGVTADMTAAQLVADNAYILIDDNTFQKVGAEATDVLAKGKAYLKVAAAEAQARQIFISAPTAVNAVAEKAEQAENVIYNMQGMRVKNADASGLYIVNGKKYIKK